jgi:hypothetical protein
MQFLIGSKGKAILTTGCEFLCQMLWEGEGSDSFSYPDSLGILKQKGECNNEERTFLVNFFNHHAGYHVFGIC